MGEAQKKPWRELLTQARVAFDEGQDFTLAVEEEFALLDTETLALAAHFEELASLDSTLLTIVAGSLDGAVSARLRREAEEELAAFGQRIAPEARDTSVEAAYLRLVREAARLPRIRFE